MKRTIGLFAAVLLAASSVASAQDATTNNVAFSLKVNQPSMFDVSKNDTFEGVVEDKTGITTLKLTCSAGASGMLGFGRVDEKCSVAGLGLIKNPKDLTKTMQRINYGGSYTIWGKRDGYVDATTIRANYLRAGPLGAEVGAFGGNLVMMPENPSAGAAALRDRLLKKIVEKSTGINEVAPDNKIDSIRFENFVVPNVGFAATSCSWNGDEIYAYANNAWQAQFVVKCGDITYKLEGNMALVNVEPGNTKIQEYRLNLVVPGVGGGDPFAAADPFEVTNGLVGTLRLENSGQKTADDVYENVKVTGELTGTGVPLELTRGFGQTMILLARTYYGE